MTTTVNGFVSEKWEKVYQTIPNDGSTIRFKEISEKLPTFSRSTISAALDCFCNIGYVHKNIKSKKNVEYSRTSIIHEATNIPFHRRMLLEMKNKGCRCQDCNDSLSIVQAGAFNIGATLLYYRLLKMLDNYAKEPNEEKRISSLNRTLQLDYIPILKSLIMSLIDDIGLQDNVLEELFEIHKTQHFPKKRNKRSCARMLNRQLKKLKSD
ncbi:MAG: hypothetical protein A2W22_01570 [Candidatus Levybacteria bacterium RBG_16_35_11]|nr:MAG: hypothetical protein A2W22_01570 [Candidatus Levybacteria bacterium RBG_16_35_11]